MNIYFVFLTGLILTSTSQFSLSLRVGDSCNTQVKDILKNMHQSSSHHQVLAVSFHELSEALSSFIQIIADEYQNVENALDYSKMQSSTLYRHNKEFFISIFDSFEVVEENNFYKFSSKNGNLTDSDIKSFYINLHNFIVIQSIIEFEEHTKTYQNVGKLFQEVGLKLGNLVLSAHDILHNLIINGESLTTCSSQEIDESLLKKDPRFIALAFTGTESSPRLRAASAKTLNTLLAESVTDLCDSVVILQESYKIMISDAFKTIVDSDDDSKILQFLFKCTTKSENKFSLYLASIEPSLYDVTFMKERIKQFRSNDEDKHPMKINVFLESLQIPQFPDFLDKHLFPAWTLLKDIMSVSFHITSDKQSHCTRRYDGVCELEKQCKSSEEIFTCVKLFNQENTTVNFLKCFIEKKGNVCDGTIKCSSENGILYASIYNCVMNGIGKKSILNTPKYSGTSIEQLMLRFFNLNMQLPWHYRNCGFRDPSICTNLPTLYCAAKNLPVKNQMEMLSCTKDRPKNMFACAKLQGITREMIDECSILFNRYKQKNSINIGKSPFEVFIDGRNSYAIFDMNERKDLTSSICAEYKTRFSKGNKPVPYGCKVDVEIQFSEFNLVRHFVERQLLPMWRRSKEALNIKLTVKIPANLEDCRDPLHDCKNIEALFCAVENHSIDKQMEMLSCMIKKPSYLNMARECSHHQGITRLMYDECQKRFFDLVNDYTSRKRQSSDAFIDYCSHHRWNQMLFTECLDRNRNKMQEYSDIFIDGVKNAQIKESTKQNLQKVIQDSFFTGNDRRKMIRLPEGMPVKVELFLSMMCPDSKKFVQEQLVPSFKKLSKIMHLHIIPFGKSNVQVSSNTKNYTFECQHGPSECLLNKLMSCIVEREHVEEHVVKQLNCIMNEVNQSTVFDHTHGLKTIEKCARYGNCYNSPQGSKLLFNNGLKTAELNPKLFNVPTVTINEYYDVQQLQRSLTDFEIQICEVYQGPFSKEKKKLTPVGCRVTIDVFLDSSSSNASTNFISEQLIPVWNKMQDSIRVNLVPFENDLVPFERDLMPDYELCKNRTSCESNLVLSCVAKSLNKNIKFLLKFLECTGKTGLQQCAISSNLNWKMIQSCVKNYGYKIFEENTLQVSQVEPKLTSLPTVTINKYYIKMDSLENFDLHEEVCSSFYSPERIPSPTWRPFGCKINVAVYLGSLCPDSKEFLHNQLLPAYDSLKSIMNLKFVPFGKAAAYQTANGEYLFNCQHGAAECHGNALLSCVVKETSIDEQLQIFACLLDSSTTDLMHKAEQCVQATSLSWNVLANCLENNSSELLFEHGLKTAQLSPNMFYVPTVTINGYYDKFMLKKLLKRFKFEVCSIYETHASFSEQSALLQIPDGCKTEITVNLMPKSDRQSHELTTKQFIMALLQIWKKLQHVINVEFARTNIGIPCSETPENICVSHDIIMCAQTTLQAEHKIIFLTCLADKESESKDIQECLSVIKEKSDEMRSCVDEAVKFDKKISLPTSQHWDNEEALFSIDEKIWNSYPTDEANLQQLICKNIYPISKRKLISDFC